MDIKHFFTLFSLGSLLAISLAMVAVVSCDCNCQKPEEAVPEKAIHVSAERLKVLGEANTNGKIKTYSLWIDKWYYEGHDYIQFRDGRYYGIAWIHDPACRCNGVHSNLPGQSDYQKLFGSH